jgi:hypothetical protein
MLDFNGDEIKRFLGSGVGFPALFHRVRGGIRACPAVSEEVTIESNGGRLTVKGGDTTWG